MLKTKLEIELEKVLKEKGYYFIETNREQIDRFAQADLEKYPEYKELLENKTEDVLHPDFLGLCKKAIEAGTTIPESPARFEIASRLLHEALKIKRGTYKIKTALINDFIINYRVMIDPIDNPEEAYSNGDVHEFLVINKQDEEREKNILVFQYNHDLKLYTFEFFEGIEECVNLQSFDKILEYQLRINVYKDLILAMDESEKMPDPPELDIKEFVEKIIQLIEKN